jgi:hypothetical protein
MSKSRDLDNDESATSDDSANLSAGQSAESISATVVPLSITYRCNVSPGYPLTPQGQHKHRPGDEFSVTFEDGEEGAQYAADVESGYLIRVE